MKMKQNRLLCLIAAASLLFSLPLQALAEGPAEAVSAAPSLTEAVPGLSGEEEKPQEPVKPEEEKPAGKPEEPAKEEEEPVIQVTVPATGRVILNPYGMKVSMNGRESTEQVVGQTYTLKNESETPVTVWASAVGSVPAGSEAVLVSEPPSSESQGKEAFLFAEFRLREEGGWSNGYTGEKNQLLVSAEQEKQPVLTLPEGVDGEFRLFGSTSLPLSSMWTAADTVDVSFAFSFTTADWWAEPEKSNPAIEAISPAASDEDVFSSQTETDED